MRTSLAVAALAGVLACSRTPVVPAEPEPTRGASGGAAGGTGGSWSGDTLLVAHGGTATHAPSGVRATFLTLVSDNRCPIDALCVTAGDAVVRVRLDRGGTPSDTTLHWGGQPGIDLQAVRVDGWRVKLLNVTPFPSASTPRPDDSAHTLWLLVQREGQ